jgi:hypothetical protein
VLTALSAAIVAAVASLAGVTLGALVEPLKLNAARRAKLRQDRADRCAGLIEASVRARQHIIDLNIVHRRRKLTDEDVEVITKREAEYEDLYYGARSQMRSFFGLIVMSGPDELVAQVAVLRDKEMRLHHTRFDLDPDGVFHRPTLPARVREATVELDRAIEEFAIVARRYTA